MNSQTHQNTMNTRSKSERRHVNPSQGFQSRTLAADRSLLLRIMLPTAAALVLCAVVLLVVVLPTFRTRMMEQKKVKIRELVNLAHEVLLLDYLEEAEGRLGRDQAQRRAIEHIRALRYGADSKEYFWINDMDRRMVMHPYRTDLEGKDFSSIVDRTGTSVADKFVEIARNEGRGYVHYYWQWRDQVERIAPKISYIRHFEPWDWIIGTGLYSDDVHAEIRGMLGKLTSVSLGVLAIVTLLCAYILHGAWSLEKRRRETEADLIDSHSRLQSLTSELALAEERERRRIATELHDGVCQSLAASKMQLVDLRRSVHSPETDHVIHEAIERIEETMQQARALTFDLSPPILYELGLAPALEWLTEKTGGAHGLQVSFQDDGKAKTLEEDVRVVLFQVARELLLNAVKYANAKNLRVAFERADGQVRLTVEDDGIGFDPQAARRSRGGVGGFGLFSIRERLTHLGGTLVIRSAPGEGTTVAATVPVKTH